MFIDEKKIAAELEQNNNPDSQKVDEILAKAKEMKGLGYQDVLVLLNISDELDTAKLFETARWVKNEIYGNRLVLFAPLYISNLCNNECLYCAFRSDNSGIKRKSLDQGEIVKETEVLVDQGHKRVLLVAGESYGREGLKYVLDSIESVYSVKRPKGEVRRINVNIAPLSVDEFKTLHEYNIGTYQIFQETYHPSTYKKIHVRGPKSDYENRLYAMDRAFQGGFDDVGVGILFGLADWRFEIMALLQHVHHLEDKFGVGPHTISIPRIEPAAGSDISYNPPHAVGDEDFKKIIAVLRLAVPYTGIILSTRENSQMRRDAFELGISQISAGSRTNPGGYGLEGDLEEQFSLGDTRSLEDVIADMVGAKHIASFCTGCYRLGRVGADFMDLAKPGLIKDHCLPNAIFTFAEYLQDFAGNDLKSKGEKFIQDVIKNDIKKESVAKNVLEKLEEINGGLRDIYF